MRSPVLFLWRAHRAAPPGSGPGQRLGSRESKQSTAQRLSCPCSRPFSGSHRPLCDIGNPLGLPGTLMTGFQSVCPPYRLVPCRDTACSRLTRLSSLPEQSDPITTPTPLHQCPSPARDNHCLPRVPTSVPPLLQNLP